MNASTRRSSATAIRPGTYPPATAKATRPVHRPTRDQQAQSATRQEQQHALDEHLPNQPASARPECRADQALSRARHAARQQEVRHVCAGNQEVRAPPHSASTGDRSPPWRTARRSTCQEAAVRIRGSRSSRVLASEAPAQNVQRRLRLFNRNAALEPGEYVEVAVGSAPGGSQQKRAASGSPNRT